MSLRPYKFLVQAVVQQTDDDGNVTAEIVGEAQTVYGCDALTAWAAAFPENLAREADTGTE